MASLGTVQAVLDIDAGKAIASLTSLGKSSVQAAKALQDLGKQQEAAQGKLDKGAGNFRNLFEKFAVGNMPADSINKEIEKLGANVDWGKLWSGFNATGNPLANFSRDEITSAFRGIHEKYSQEIAGMMQDNKLLAMLPESWRNNLAKVVGLVDLYMGKIRKGTTLHSFAEQNFNYSNIPLSVQAMTAATQAAQLLGSVTSVAASGIALVGKSAAIAVAGVIGLANALKFGYNALVSFAQKDPTLDLFQRAEKYESALRKISAQAEGQGNGYNKADYDAFARDFSTLANVTRTEALDIAKSLTMVGNMAQTFGARIRKGTEIGKEAIGELDGKKLKEFVSDFAALQGFNFRSPEELKKSADNLRLAFSNWGNFEALASKLSLFTDEQQKSIEKTKALKGESAALAEAFGYLPENIAGLADKATTPLENAWDSLRASVRTAWDGIADNINWDGISEKLAGLFGNIGEKLSGFLSGASEWIAPMVEGIANGIIDGVQWIVSAFSGIKEAATRIFDDIANNPSVHKFAEAVGGAFDAIAERIGGTLNSSALDGFVDALGNIATAALDVGAALANAFTVAIDVSQWIIDFLHIDEILGWIISTIGSLIGVIGDLVSIAVDGWKLIINGVQDLWASVSSQEAWGQLGKGISNAISWFGDLYDKAMGFIGGIKNAIAGMFSAAGSIISGIKERASQAVQIAGDRANAAAGGNVEIAPAVQAEVAKLQQSLEKNTQTLDTNSKQLNRWNIGNNNTGGGGGGRRRGGGGRGGASEADKQAERDAKAAERYLKTLREQAQEINRMTKLERLRYDIETGAIKLSDEQLAKAKEFAEIIDNRVRLQRQERIEIELSTQALSYRRESEDSQLRVSDIGAQFTMPDRLFSQMQELRSMALEYQRKMEDMQLRERQDIIGKSQEEIAEIRAKYAKMGEMAEAAYLERVQYWQMEVDAVEQFSHDIGANYKKGLFEVADWYSNLGKDIQSATTSWANKTADALASFVRKGKLDFKSLADSILDDIARIASQQFVSSLVSGAMNGWTGGGGRSGGGGGFLSGIVSLFKGFFGFSSGGYTGAGGKLQPAGIVHAGEFVINAGSTRRLVDEFGWDFLKNLNGYSGGGYVTPLPSIVKSGGVVADSDLVVNIYNQTDSKVTARRNNNGGLDVFIKQAVDAVAANIAQGGNVASAMQGAYSLNRGMGVQRRGF